MTVTTAPAALATGTRPTYSRLGTVELALAALAPLSIFLVGLASGATLGDVGFFAIVAAIGLAGAGAVWWLGAIGKILGIVASVLVGGALFWTVFGLAYPARYTRFLTDLGLTQQLPAPA
ncbi:MAG: hypothetical protein ACRDZO_14865 [Egibacteraceae bacterium]